MIFTILTKKFAIFIQTCKNLKFHIFCHFFHNHLVPRLAVHRFLHLDNYFNMKISLSIHLWIYPQDLFQQPETKNRGDFLYCKKIETFHNLQKMFQDLK